jgi:CRP/FNR family transcriptional regulator, cyclic AMP receptor protein
MDPTRLRTLPLFQGLSRRELDTVSRRTDEVDLPDGKQLVKEGDFGYEFFAIEEGTAEVRHDDAVIAELGPGDFFGEAALSGQLRRNASVVATSPLTAIVMTASDFRQMRRDVPSVCDRIQRSVAERALTTQ